MRNGISGVGVVLEASNLQPSDWSAMHRLDAVISAPFPARYDQDIFCLVFQSEDDAEDADTIRTADALRIVFIGKPGKKTLAALIARHEPSGLVKAFVVDTTVFCFRVYWKDWQPPLIEKSPNFETRAMKCVTETHAQKRSQKRAQSSRAKKTRNVSDNSTTSSTDADRRTTDAAGDE